MKLPDAFINKYTDLLKDEAPQFFKAFDEPVKKAYRINPLKANQELFDTPNEGRLEYSPFAHIGKVYGHSIDHTTGVVYSQEPSAMFVGEVAHPQIGDYVLDLSAAPGGKATHLASYLQQSGLLVANEIIKKRAEILAENIERFGVKNTLVTNETPERLAKQLPEFFDKIVVDAPCSGEGMFRKDHDAMQYWNLEYPAKCATLQREILTQAVKMLKPEAELIYSTCTFAPEENEQIIAWLLATYPEFSLMEIDKPNGIDNGRPEWADGNPELQKTARIFPHHFNGEGHFVAKLKWHAEETSVKRVTEKSNLSAEQVKQWNDFANNMLLTQLEGTLITFGDQLYNLPVGMPTIKKMNVIRPGLHLGTFKKNRFEPSLALGMTLNPLEVNAQVELDKAQWIKYAHGETVTLKQMPSNGNDWYQIVVNGNGFGFGKVVGQTLKNFYPKGLRFVYHENTD